MNKKLNRVFSLGVLVTFFVIFLVGCGGDDDGVTSDVNDFLDEIKEEGGQNNDNDNDNNNNNNDEETQNYVLPEIDLSHWKVTLPIKDDNGKLIEVLPPEILDYATNETLKPFMYNDSINGALVFYTYPESTTANSSYSRTELRELINPEDRGKSNWTFQQGGKMKGKLAVTDITKDNNGDYHRTIIMQIHGRLTDEQRDLIGAKDNNAPPMLKIYWHKGAVRVKTKVLKDLEASYEELLHTDAWGDDDGHNFSEQVGFEPFTLEIIASEGKMEVILNDNEKVVYDDIHIEKWGVFENYFKAGNYLSTKDQGANATVKYYELEVIH